MKTFQTLQAGGGGYDAHYDEQPELKDVPRPEPGQHWKVGESRAQLRHKFNRQELDVAKVIRRYDIDGDWKLEQHELKNLLQDQNRWFAHITQDELAMVFQIADADHNGCIEPNEVLYALRVWYAYVNMPKTADQVVAPLSDVCMPTPDTLREALLLLNDDRDVSIEEAEYVRHVALAIGGTEQWVSKRQMKMAIATWYLHVARKETSRGELAKHAFFGAHTRISGGNPIGKCFRGECNALMMCLCCTFFVIWGIVPAIAILIGMNSDTGNYQCRSPMLGIAVTLTGILALAQGCGCITLATAFEYTEQKAVRMLAGLCVGLITFLIVIIWALGMWQLSYSSLGLCGIVIWETANFIWIVVPVGVGFFFCFCMPGIVLYEYCHQSKLDRELTRGQAGGADHHYDSDSDG